MKIRRALAGDFDAVVRLTDAAYAPYAQSIPARMDDRRHGEECRDDRYA
ncbi:hypothetical protein [Mesorhizobium sp. M1322]